MLLKSIKKMSITVVNDPRLDGDKKPRMEKTSVRPVMATNCNPLPVNTDSIML
jgi:hypothetical protein